MDYERFNLNDHSRTYDDGGFPCHYDLLKDYKSLDREKRVFLYGAKMKRHGFDDMYIKAAKIILSRDDFIDLDGLLRVLLAAKKLDLNPHLFNEVNKNIWLELALEFEQLKIVKYMISSPKKQHWYIICVTDNNMYVKAELYAEKGLDRLKSTIAARNDGKFDHNTFYNYPQLLVNVEGEDDNLLVCCEPPVQWTTFIISMMLDDESFKPYCETLNNSQQWVERICGCCGFKLPEKPKVTDELASYFRNAETATRPENNS